MKEEMRMEATDAVVSAIEKFGNMKPPKYDVSIFLSVLLRVWWLGVFWVGANLAVCSHRDTTGVLNL
jgi:hypothetical protein